MFNKIYNVICEGKSEEAYLNEFSKLLRNEDIPYSFIPKNAGDGHYRTLLHKYREEFKKNKKNEFLILTDFDIYHRNDCGNMDSYRNKPAGVPDFCFNHENFEDFIALHLEDELLQRWINICCGKKHFITPMHSTEYCPLFREHIIPNYKKGNFPFESFSIDIVKRAIRNNKRELPIKSNFLSEIEIILNSYLV